jgi:hypothetical protein
MYWLNFFYWLLSLPLYFAIDLKEIHTCSFCHCHTCQISSVFCPSKLLYRYPGLSVRTGVGVYIGKVGGQQSSSLINCRQIFDRHLGIAEEGGGTRGQGLKFMTKWSHMRSKFMGCDSIVNAIRTVRIQKLLCDLYLTVRHSCTRRWSQDWK